MPSPRFDPTINLGHIFTFFGFLLAAAGAYYGIRMETQAISFKVDATAERVVKMEGRVEEITDLMLVDARREAEIKALRDKVAELNQRVDRLQSTR